MYCTKCGAKIESNDKFCNSCGSLSIKKQLNIKKVFWIMLVVFIVAGGYLGFSRYQNNKVKESIYLIDKKIQESSMACSGMIVEISTLWSKTIDESIKYAKHDLEYNPTEEEIRDYVISMGYEAKTPEEAIAELMNKKWSISDKLKKRENEKNVIKGLITELKNMKDKKVYDELTEYFLVYEKIYFTATNPSGSLLSYNTESTKLFTELKEKQSRLDLAISSK